MNKLKLLMILLTTLIISSISAFGLTLNLSEEFNPSSYTEDIFYLNGEVFNNGTDYWLDLSDSGNITDDLDQDTGTPSLVNNGKFGNSTEIKSGDQIGKYTTNFTDFAICRQSGDCAISFSMNTTNAANMYEALVVLGTFAGPPTERLVLFFSGDSTLTVRAYSDTGEDFDCAFADAWDNSGEFVDHTVSFNKSDDRIYYWKDSVSQGSKDVTNSSDCSTTAPGGIAGVFSNIEFSTGDEVARLPGANGGVTVMWDEVFILDDFATFEVLSPPTPAPPVNNAPATTGVNFNQTDYRKDQDMSVSTTVTDDDGDTMTVNVTWSNDTTTIFTESNAGVSNGTLVTFNLARENYTAYQNITAQIDVDDAQNLTTVSGSKQINVTQCSDGTDNDLDNATDTLDNDCDDSFDNSESGTTQPECSNTIDDDGDGDTDFPLDADCDDANDDSELGVVTPTGFTADYVFADFATITGDVIGQAGIEAGDFTSLFVALAVFALGAVIITGIVKPF